MAVHAELDGAAAKQSNRGLGDSPSPDVDLRVLGEVVKEVNALKSSKHLKPKQLRKYRQAVKAAAAAALRQLDLWRRYLSFLTFPFVLSRQRSNLIFIEEMPIFLVVSVARWGHTMILPKMKV